MTTQSFQRIRSISLLLVPAVAVWLIYFGLAFAQNIQIQQSTNVLDLEPLIPLQGFNPIRFTAIRANDTGVFVWTEAGANPRSGERDVAVHHMSESGLLLRSTPLPRGARLSQVGDFGLDAAGNIYFLFVKRNTLGASDELFLMKVDPRGEIVEQYPLPGRPATFAVGPGRVSLLSNDATVSAVDAPTVPIAQGYSPSRAHAEAPPRWWPLLEETPNGLLLVDGIEGTMQAISGFVPEEPRPIPSENLQTVVRHIREAHPDTHSAEQHAAGMISLKPALRGSSVDEDGNLYFSLMGTRPRDGMVVVRLGPEGDTRPPLRLGVPVDKDRPDAFGKQRSGGDGALMFPQDFAVRHGKVFVLGIHGLLATYVF